MADPQAETVQIVVEVVDKFSKPLNDLKKQIEGFGKVGESAGKVTKEMVGLKDAIESVSKVAGTLIPGLGSSLSALARIIPGISTGILAIGAAMAYVGKQVYDWKEATVELSYLRKETGLNENAMRGLQGAWKDVGVSTAQAQQGFRTLAEQAYETRRGMGTLYETLRGTGASSAAAIQLAEELRHTTDNAQFLDKVLEGIDRTSDLVEKKRIARAAFGAAGDRIALMTGEERRKKAAEVLEKGGEETDESIARAKKLKEEFDSVSKSIDGMNERLGRTSSEGLQSAIEKAKELKGEFDKLPHGFEPGAPGSPFTDETKKGPLSGDWWRRLIPPGGGQGGIGLPQGFNTQDQEQIKKPIKSAFVEGLNEYFGPSDATLPKGATPISYSPDGGGGGGARDRFLGRHGLVSGGGATTDTGGGVGSIPPMGGGGPVGDGGGTAPTGKIILPKNKQETAGIVADEFRKAGMSEAGIAGVLANIKSESNFNPAERHFDQPGYTRKHGFGEHSFSHGLYQEGGDEWHNYVNWLNKNFPGEDWRNPRLQSRFAAERLKTGYGKTWDAMNRGSKEQAAEAYLRGYLKPAPGPMAGRAGQYRRGVPGVSAYTGGADRMNGFAADEAQRAGARLGGAANATAQRVEGNANLRIQLDGFPPGTKTGYATSGDLFGNVDVVTNRGFTRPNASEQD